MKKISMKTILVWSTFILLLILAGGCSSPYQPVGATNTAASFGHNTGINLFASQLDYAEDRLFADAMKTAREWVTTNTYGGGAVLTNLDTNGWPTGDAECIVWHGLYNCQGTYYLVGESGSEPLVTAGFGGGTISNFSYSAGKFSAYLLYTQTNGAGLLLTFRNTGNGVRNVKLMRPRSPGSREHYPVGTAFTGQVKKMVEPFKVVRFMWTVDAWNGAWQTNWSDRVKPTAASYNRDSASPAVGWAGMGMAWEEAVRFCNETGKDMWINMPLGANDDYIRQLAALIRDTYTVPDGRIYWEYSNEATWDLVGITSGWLRAKGLEEAATNGPVAYDGETDDQNILAARYYAKRAAEMSLLWREVWGDAAMMTRVRPIAGGQLSYDSELIWGLDFVHNWFNNGSGTNVAVPHPVNYFFYGCGASHYSGDDPDRLLTNGRTEIAQFEVYEREEAALAKIYGLKRCAYEGGVWTTSNSYQLSRIEDAMVRYHDLWNKYDNDLFVYYVTTGGEENGTALGFTLSAFKLDTPKYRALDRILAAPKPPVLAGVPAPCVIAGAAWDASSVPWEHPLPAGITTNGGTQFDEYRTYKGYLIRVTQNRTFQLSLSYNNTTSADIEVMVNGSVIARQILSGTSSPAWTVTLSPGLHGIRVRKANPGYFFLNSIDIR